jgi:two-component system, cell cycle sensor histidine kinase and response regulator CckA
VTDPILRRGAARGWSALAADPRALARILDGAPYPAWIQRVDEAGFPCVAINDACAAAYGYTALELIGTLAREIMPPDDWTAYEAVVEEVVARGVPLSRRFHASGEVGELIYDMVLTPLVDESGVVTQVFGISRDVTDETTSLHTSIERLRAVFRSAHDATLLLTPEGICLDANRAAADLFVLDDEHELLGLDLNEFVDRGREVLDHVSALPAGEVLSDTIEVRRRDGSVRVTACHVEAHVQPDVHLVMARDVTEQLTAVAALHESESRFRVLADSAPALIWTTEPDGAAATFNRGWVEFRGCTIEEELAAGVFAGVHPEDRERCLTVFQTALATQTGYSLTHRLRRGDGEYRWLLSRASPRVLADGTFLGHVGASVDVTDQVEAEAALRAERDHQHAITAALQDALIESDRHGRILDANDRFYELTGFTADEVIGADLPYPWWPEEWRERLEADATEALRSGRNEVDSVFCRKDGVRFPVAISVSTVGTGPETSALIGTVRDMTARQEAADALRRSEERFRALVENAPDIIAILDREGRLIEASPSAGVILGLEPESYIGRSIFELVHPDDQERMFDVFTERLREPGFGGTVEFRLAASDGSWRVIEAIGNNLLDDPAVGAFVVNARDVTERSRLEEQLAQAQKLEAVGRLAGGIAHDFNNVLTAISGYAELLLADVPAEFEHREDLEELARAADRASALVEQLLAFARKQAVQPTVFDIHAVIRSMEGMLRQLLGPAVGLAVGGPGIPADVRADRSQLEQVLLNLVVNARDASRPGGGQIVIRTEIVDLPADDRVDPDVPSGRYVVVSVRDDGAGMDLSTQAQAFEPFFTTKEGKGTGLGLSIVYGIVTQSGGHLHVESEPGAGTTVRVYLPYVAGDGAAIPVPESPAPLVDSRPATVPVESTT